MFSQACSNIGSETALQLGLLGCLLSSTYKDSKTKINSFREERLPLAISSTSTSEKNSYLHG